LSDDLIGFRCELGTEARVMLGNAEPQPDVEEVSDLRVVHVVGIGRVGDHEVDLLDADVQQAE
jgi:hypothetical protein